MRQILPLTRWELAGFFRHISGYAIIASVMLVIGLSFIAVVLAINGEAVDAPITESLYSTPFFWLIILLATPAITMRAYAQEKSSGTYEILTTSPVSSVELVVAKFLGAWLFFLVVWLPFLGYLFVLRPFFDDPSLLDFRIVAASLVGVGLLGALFTSVGCLVSSLTRSQMLSAMLTFAIGMLFFLQSFVTFQLPDTRDMWSLIFAQTSLFRHLEDFVRGIIDSRHIMFYLTLTFFFLYLNWQSVESRRWL